MTVTLIAGAILLMLTGLAVSKRLFGTILAPMGLYSVTWYTAIILYVVSPIPWPAFSTRSSMAVLLAWTGFCVGCIAVSGKRIRITTGYLSDTGPEIDEHFLRITIIVFGVIGLFGSLFSIWKVAAMFSPELIFTKPWVVRHRIVLTGNDPLGTLSNTVLLAFTFAAASLSGVYIGRYSARFLPAYVPIVAIAIRQVAVLGRWEMVALVLLYVFSWLFSSLHTDDGINFIVPSLFVGVGAAFILGMSFFVGKTGTYLVQYSDVLPPLVLSFYNRLNVPIEGLNHVVSQPSPYTSGKNIFRPVTKLLNHMGVTNIDPLPEMAMRVNPLAPQWGKRFRGISDLGFIYLDFGWPGLAVVPFLFGVVTSILFRHRSALSVAVLSFICAELIWYNGWYFVFPFYTGAFLLVVAAGVVFQLWRQCVTGANQQSVT